MPTPKILQPSLLSGPVPNIRSNEHPEPAHIEPGKLKPILPTPELALPSDAATEPDDD